MNHFKYIKKLSLCFWTTLLIMGPACKKFVAVEPPGNQLELNRIFSDDAAAISAATGLYNRMTLTSLSVANGGVTLYTGLSSDEFYNVSPRAELDLFATNELVPGNGTGLYTHLWKASYQNIYHANAVLEGLARSANVSAAVKKQLMGEMLVGRALNYFYLINLFGAVPFITSTDYDANNRMGRTEVGKIYQQLTNDLLEAEALLSNGYPSAEKARPNKFAATALLARIYLFRQNWSNAAEKAGAVIASGQYMLEHDLTQSFLSGSRETIWQLKPAGTFMNTAEGVEFNPSYPSAVPAYSLRTGLLAAFEPGDKRKTAWVSSNTAAGQPIFFPHKYKVGFSNTLTEYYVVCRLAEMYLIRAEARTRLNFLDDARADVNSIRSRAALANTIAIDQQDLLSAVAQEKRIEFFAEWGHRWLDLKRTGSADAVLGALKPGWQSTDALYPIPLSQVQINAALTQNPGY